MSKRCSDALNKIFEKRKEFILIGLTGKTGSGCSTVADLLSKDSFVEFDAPHPKYDSFNDMEERKYLVTYDYLKNNWISSVVISVRNIITKFAFEGSESDIAEMFGEHADEILKIKAIFKETFREITDRNSNSEMYNFYLNKINEYTDDISKILGNTKFNLIYQKLANNIRLSGNAYRKHFDEKSNFTIAMEINKLIKIIRDVKTEKAIIIIDAIRNPFEVTFFKDRYSAFYLFSVNCSKEERKLRLSNKLIQKDIEALDKIEAPEKLEGVKIFIHQNIQRCIELSDVYLYNPTDLTNLKYELKIQLVRYITLCMHPGIVTPTKIERCMQFAVSAKVNSGCISRQVGAVVTDDNYNIRSIGWNDVPEGQTPCNLKNLRNIESRTDKDSFSDYELYDAKFRATAKKIIKVVGTLKKYNLPYCFKDIYNGIKEEKNQVYTRSLHAEENAFLQISKLGGISIQGGNLFTTASPCELCAKKAYQLGIKKIFYIDLYPGISKEHILENGKNRPIMVLFNGVIGRAYNQLYTPIISYKDELYIETGYDFKEYIIGESIKEKEIEKSTGSKIIN